MRWARIYKSHHYYETFKKYWCIITNAVRIQIYVTIITYCLADIVQYDIKIDRRIY